MTWFNISPSATSALLSESATQMNECDAAPGIAWRKSKVAVVTSYGSHFSNRLAYDVFVPVSVALLTRTARGGDDKFTSLIVTAKKA